MLAIPMGSAEDRLLAFAVAATMAIAIIELARERQERFAKWRSEFLAPFRLHPGRRAFLRDVLIREEMNVKDRSYGS